MTDEQGNGARAEARGEASGGPHTAPPATEAPGTAPAGAPAENPWAPLGALMRPVRGRLALAMGLQSAAALAGLVPFLAVVSIGRDLLAHGTADRHRIWVLVAVAVAALLLRAALGMAAGALAHLVDGDLQLGIRRRLVARLRAVPPAWMARRGSGEVNNVLQNDVEALHHAVAHTPGEVASALVVPAACTVYLALTDWRLTLIVLLCPIAGLLMYRQLLGPRRRRDKGAMEAAMGRIASGAVEFVQGVAPVRMFGTAGRAHERFVRAADDFSDAFLGWVRTVVNLAAAAVVVLSAPVVLAVAAFGGGVLIITGHMPAADLPAFLLVGTALTAPVSALGHGMDNVIAARDAAVRINELLDVRVLPAPAAPRPPAGSRVEFSGLSYSYEDGTAALHGIDLVLEPGTRTALVGPSGSGKSTLARMLARFDDPGAGAVRLGGVDLRELDAAVLYRSVAFVFQEVVLLHASVHENIAMGDPGVPRERVEQAARAAGIHDRISALPRGYDSVVGEDAAFSGGEGQRVSVARALLLDAPVLVLDEATAFADPESEAALHRALDRLAEGRTLLVIAHRPAAVSGADRIVLLDEGRIAEQGTHEELLARSGRYAALWRASSEREDEPGPSVRS